MLACGRLELTEAPRVHQSNEGFGFRDRLGLRLRARGLFAARRSYRQQPATAVLVSTAAAAGTWVGSTRLAIQLASPPALAAPEASSYRQLQGVSILAPRVAPRLGNCPLQPGQVLHWAQERLARASRSVLPAGTALLSPTSQLEQPNTHIRAAFINLF